MKATGKLRDLPVKVKKQIRIILLLLCAVATFAAPASVGGYSILKDETVIGSAAAIEDVDLLLVAASAFGEARKVMNATDLDAKDTFVRNTESIISYKWQNVGLIVGSRDALSGSTWSTYQSPVTLSATEVETYGSSSLGEAYNKYKSFGYAIQNMNRSAQKSNTSAVSVNEGLDAMSTAAIQLGSFGTKFLDEYNPGPVLLSLYDSRNLGRYPDNKLVQIVVSNDTLYNLVSLFGDRVPGTPFSFFVLFNAVTAIIMFALSQFIVLLGNRTIGDTIRKLVLRVVIGSGGIYVIATVMSTALGWVTDTIMNVEVSETSHYVENNLNVYDWYLTGFQLPALTELKIDSTGNFVFDRATVRAINEYTYRRLVGEPADGDIDRAMQERMETYAQNGNIGTASFVTPSITSADGGEAWATDVYYAVMNNYAQNKELTDGRDDEGSALYGKSENFNLFWCRYLWMSSLSMSSDGSGGWTVTGNGSTSYYGLNPISAFNLVRSDFSGEAISSTQTVYPKLAYVAFDVVKVPDVSSTNNMNSITRFIASFTLILAAMQGLITIFTAGFGGLLSGGIKTATGSSHGIGQALGAVVTLVFGVVGISVIMSSILSLLDTIYGIAKSLVLDTDIVMAFLQPMQDALSGIPVLGAALTTICKTGIDMILTLIMALTFPKLGKIPITMFAQFMSEIPGHMAEKAQMIEGMVLSGRSSAGGGLPPGGRGQSGRYSQQAQQMGAKAFQGGARQAGQVIKAGAMAATSLAGASLSAAGKAINRKADALEGKPENPGLGNWDDMSAEQQARAADVAAGTDGWNEMSEEARQQVLKDAGVYDDNNAHAPGNDDPVKNEQPTQETTGPGEQEKKDGKGAGDKDNKPPVEGEKQDGEKPVDNPVNDPNNPNNPAGMQQPVQEASMSNPVEKAEPEEVMESGGTAGGAGDQDGDKSLNGKEESVNGGTGQEDGNGGEETGEETVEGTEGGREVQEAAPGDSLNTENTTVEGGDQKSDVSVEQTENEESLNVDESRAVGGPEDGQLPEGTDPATGLPSTVDGNVPGTGGLNPPGDTSGGKDGTHGSKGTTEKATSVNGGGTSGGTVSGKSGGGLPPGKSGNSSPGQGGAPGGYHSVNNTNQTGGNSSTHINAQANRNMQARQNVNAKGSADQSRTLNGNQGKDAGRMDGMAKSKYGKNMTIREQRQARALHAIGDGLQMMGGNRTFKQGIREALSYTAEAAAASVVPPEMMSAFAQDLRNKRQIRNELRRHDVQNNKKK